MFGRVPLAFPNLFLPAWQIEGLATYEESGLTGRGRLHRGRLPRDRARGGPDGAARAARPRQRRPHRLARRPAPYAYGLGFHEFLAARFGEARFHELAQRTAGRLPYTGFTAFPPVFGQSLGSLWREYEDVGGRLQRPPAQAPLTSQTRQVHRIVRTLPAGLRLA